MSDSDDHRVRHKRLQPYPDHVDAALFQSELLPGCWDAKTLDVVRTLANCIQTMRECDATLTSSIEAAARLLMIDSALDWIFKSELVLRIKGFANADGSLNIKTKSAALVAMAKLAPVPCSNGVVYKLSAFCDDEATQPYGRLTIDTRGLLLDTFPKCSDIMLGAVREAEWLASDLTDFDTALLRGKRRRGASK